MTERKKILWLVSWYPNRKEKFDGDFIQRHARAAAIFDDIHVVFVRPDNTSQKEEVEWNYQTGLTEQIIYFREPRGIFSTIKKQWTWKKLNQRAVEDYMQKTGSPDLVHVHIPWKSGIIALWIKKKFQLPFIITEHWGVYQEDLPDSILRKPKFIRNLLENIFREAKALITVSKFLDKGIQKFSGRKSDFILPNVVDTSLFFYKPEKYSKFSFIHVSNMVPIKNISSILEAFREVVLKKGKGQVQLIMIGNRDHEYVNLAKNMGLLNEEVFFRGEIPYTDVAVEMKRSHAMVIFSQSETFSCVTAEALCSGLPVIAPNTGALPELVDHINGILVPVGNSHALALAMIQMVDNYQNYDQESIAASASAKYGYSAVAKQFRDLYHSISQG